MSGLILYTTQDSKSRIQLRAKSETVWLSQRDMTDLKKRERRVKTEDKKLAARTQTPPPQQDDKP